MREIITPNWTAIIADLSKLGMTQCEIAGHADLSQNFISDLKHKKGRSIQFEKGMRLVSLHIERVLGRKLVLVPRKAAATRQRAAQRRA